MGADGKAANIGAIRREVVTNQPLQRRGNRADDEPQRRGARGERSTFQSDAEILKTALYLYRRGQAEKFRPLGFGRCAQFDASIREIDAAVATDADSRGIHPELARLHSSVLE